VEDLLSLVVKSAKRKVQKEYLALTVVGNSPEHHILAISGMELGSLLASEGPQINCSNPTTAQRL
jgi:hypothetical protein